MKTYWVSFFKVEYQEIGKGHRKISKEEYIGGTEVDDNGVDNKTLTLAGKAFRVAPPRCLHANKVVFSESGRTNRSKQHPKAHVA